MTSRNAAKEYRKRIFRKSRPFVRPFSEADVAWLWVAYKHGSFKMQSGLNQQEFSEHVTPILGLENFIVEDDNPKFKDKRGPVAFVSVTHDGWRYEPSIVFFKWASKKNMLRVGVAFFHKTSLSSIGVCVVRWSKSVLLDHLKKYGVLFLRGKVPFGNKDGDEYIYSVLGRKGSQAMKKG